MEHLQLQVASSRTTCNSSCESPRNFKNAGKATPLTTQIANKPDPALPQSSSSAPTFCQFFLWYKHDEVHEIMRDDVQKKDYTLELHIEMKTMYENLDTFDFYQWHQEKMNYFKDTLCGYSYFHYYQRVYHIFIAIIYHLQYHIKRDKQLHYEYLEATTEFLNEMIVQSSK